MKRFIVCTLLLINFWYAQAQDSACGIRISLLTCAPGEELYSTFGHTALRVQDSNAGQDLIFNYGTFEFSNDFYIKFVRGKLNYYLSVQDFESFLYQYQMESRSITEQVLNLDCGQKQQLYQALQTNAREENKFYRYDFLFDNCTTRAKDMVKKQSGTVVSLGNILPPEPPSFRDLLHTYLNAGGQRWSKLGIDLLLGAKLDRKMTNEEAMFLPDYLLKGFDASTINAKPLVQSKQVILQMPPLNSGKSIFTPFLAFSALLILIVAATFSTRKKMQAAVRVFDRVLFSVLGLIGLLLLFMWFGTDHRVTQNNYNLLWALPTHIIAASVIWSKKRWVQSYFKGIFFLTLSLLCFWFFLPQEMNPGFLPVVVLIIFRSWIISNIGYAGKRN